MLLGILTIIESILTCKPCTANSRFIALVNIDNPRRKNQRIFSRKDFWSIFKFVRQPRRNLRGMRSLLRFKAA
jgi:hypothetical protein